MATEKIKCVLTPNNVLFIAEVTCIFIVVCVSLLNLTLENGNQHLWTMILTSSLAYLMPSPKFKMPEADSNMLTGTKEVKADSSVTTQVENGGLHGVVPSG